MQTVEHNIPRRCRVDLLTPEELKIRDTMIALEAMVAHPLLTDAVSLLSEARNKLADYIELDSTKNFQSS